MNNSNKIQDTKTSSQISKKMILSILEDGSKLPQEILLKLKLSKKYRSSLSYHLGGLVDNGTIRKNGLHYHKIQKIQTPLEQKILDIMLKDNFAHTTLNLIKEKIKKSNSDDEILKSLDSLKIQSKIYELKNEYFIEVWLLNKYNRCFVCSQELQDNELIISAMFVDDDAIVRNELLHALCRNKLQEHEDYFENTTAYDCDYCGLSLSAKNLFSWNVGTTINNEIDVLFNEPFSKIFSSISSNDYQYNMQLIDSFAHSKRKDGKQYHPYCFNIIEKQNQGKKK